MGFLREVATDVVYETKVALPEKSCSRQFIAYFYSDLNACIGSIAAARRAGR
jgi:hypothetical protein